MISMLQLFFFVMAVTSNLCADNIEDYLVESIKSGKQHIRQLSLKHEQNIKDNISWQLCDEDMKIYSYTLGALMAREDILKMIQDFKVESSKKK